MTQPLNWMVSPLCSFANAFTYSSSGFFSSNSFFSSGQFLTVSTVCSFACAEWVVVVVVGLAAVVFSVVLSGFFVVASTVVVSVKSLKASVLSSVICTAEAVFVSALVGWFRSVAMPISIMIKKNRNMITIPTIQYFCCLRLCFCSNSFCSCSSRASCCL